MTLFSPKYRLSTRWDPEPDIPQVSRLVCLAGGNWNDLQLKLADGDGWWHIKEEGFKTVEIIIPRPTLQNYEE